MIFRDPYWSKRECMDLLSRWLIVNSIIYYELSSSTCSDERFDSNSKQLMDMIRLNPEDFSNSRWYYVMYDFDGSTGFDLYGKLNKKDKPVMLQEAEWVNISIKEGWWK